MALPGPLDAATVDAWVRRQLEHAPEHLSVEQRRIIRSAIATAPGRPAVALDRAKTEREPDTPGARRVGARLPRPA